MVGLAAMVERARKVDAPDAGAVLCGCYLGCSMLVVPDGPMPVT